MLMKFRILLMNNIFMDRKVMFNRGLMTILSLM